MARSVEKASGTHLIGELRAGVFTVINLSPIDVGYGLLMVAAFGLAYAEAGIAAAFLAVVIGNTLPSLFKGTGRLFSGARPAQTLLIAELVRQVAQAGGLPPFSTVFVYVAVCTALAGLLQLGFGVLRVGNAIKYLPIPVLSGYINAVALLIVWPAFMLMLGFSKSATIAEVVQGWTLKTLWSGLFGLLLLALMAWVLAHYKKIHWSIMGLFGGMAIYHLMVWLLGVRLGDSLPQVGSVLPAWQEVGALLRGAWPVGPLDMFGTVFPFALAIAMLNSIEALVVSARYEELAESRSNANRVLISQGVANFVGGLLGALPTAPSVSRMSIAWELGGRKFAGQATAAATALVLMIVGGHFLHWVPLLVVGGLMAFLAWTMVDFWSREQIRLFFKRHTLEASLRRRVSTNVMVMLVVVAVAVTGHLISAMFVGALLAMFLFVRDYSRSVVGRSFSGQHRRSLVMRAESENRYLETHGKCIHVIELNAPLVFGTADRLFDHLETLPPELRYVILDFQQVREIDDKGARYLVRLSKRLFGQGIELHLSHIQPNGPRGTTLLAAGLDKTLPLGGWHDDTDRALESVETRLLVQADFSNSDSLGLAQLEITRGMDQAEIDILHEHMQDFECEINATVFHKGDLGLQLYILTTGQVEIRLWLDRHQGRQRRMAAFAPGVVFGEMALFGQGSRSADAVATVPSAGWILTAEALERLQTVHPAVAGKLMSNIARQLSSRLAVTNDELVYATRD